LKAYLRIAQTDTLDDVLFGQIVAAVENEQRARLRPETFTSEQVGGSPTFTVVGVFNWKTTTTVSDPGKGNFASTEPIETISISGTDIDNTDVTALLAVIVAGDGVIMQRQTSASDWITFDVLADVSDYATWFAIAVAVRQSSVANPPKPNDDVIVGHVLAADVTPLTETVPPDVYQAALMRGARLYARRASPEGLVPFGDLGVARIPSYDRDIDALEAPWRIVVLA